MAEASLHAEAAPVVREREGYAQAPHRIASRRDLPSSAKVVLNVLIGLSWKETRRTRASIARIARESGLSRRTAQDHLYRLAEAGLIAREPDPEAPGGPWITWILADPKGKQETAKTPRDLPRGVALSAARGRAEDRAGHLLQTELDFREPAPRVLEV
jgi:DNA-binding transcriptional ArsR family regulator